MEDILVLVLVGIFWADSRAGVYTSAVFLPWTLVLILDFFYPYICGSLLHLLLLLLTYPHFNAIQIFAILLHLLHHDSCEANM